MLINQQSRKQPELLICVPRVLAFFSFRQNGKHFPCAVIHWFNQIGDAPDSDTGMWTVQPSSTVNQLHFAVIHIDAIFRAAHSCLWFNSALPTDQIPPCLRRVYPLLCE